MTLSYNCGTQGGEMPDQEIAQGIAQEGNRQAPGRLQESRGLFARLL